MYVVNRRKRKRPPAPSDHDPSDHEKVKCKSMKIPQNPSLPTMRIATLCSGIEAVIQGFENLAVPFEHVASCEKDEKTRKVLERNFSPTHSFIDVMSLNLKSFPCHDILWAGFPCQPFSTTGNREGLADKTGRGILILPIINLVRSKMPKVVVLENVGGMASSHKELFDAVLDLLRGICANNLKYNVDWRTIDTKYFKVPQSRPRIWIVCVRQDVHKHAITWPTPSPEPCANIDEILGRRPPLQSLLKPLPKVLGKTTIANITKGLSVVRSRGIDPLNETYIMDIDHSKSREGSRMKGCAPCITKTRARQGGHWVSTHNRRLNMEEMLVLQSMNPDRLVRPDDVTEAQFRSMIGNSMSVNVVEAIISMLSRAAPALFGDQPVADNWSHRDLNRV